MKKIKYISIAVGAAFVCLLLYFMMPKHFKWDFYEADPNGHEPYDMAVFDSLMHRSLPEGYEVMAWQRPNEGTGGDEDDLLANTEKALNLQQRLDPKKQSVLMIQRYNCADAAGNKVSPLIAALNYAAKGGDVLLVKEQLESSDPFFESLSTNLGLPFVYVSPYSLDSYQPKQLRDRSDQTYPVGTGEETVEIHTKYTQAYFVIEPSFLEERKKGVPEIVDIVPKEGYNAEPSELSEADKEIEFAGTPIDSITPDLSELPDNDDDNARRILKKMDLSLDSYLDAANEHYYGLRIHNNKTGGNVYICTLGLYFSNLGVTLPDGDKLIAYNMEKISHKPVVRVEYNYRKTYSSDYHDSTEKNELFSVLSQNEALSFAWLLVLLLAVTALACGIYRKHPAKKDAHLEYVDETDPVAVREARFRQSPLLHFIFQYSWLYKGQRNYTDLFLINYRQFARYVNRKTGLELGSASESDIAQTSKTLAQRTGLDATVVEEDLTWMHDNKLNADNGVEISPADYVKSQQIIEKYV